MKPLGDFDASVVGDSRFDRLAIQVSIFDQIDKAAIFIVMKSLAGYRHYIFLIRDAHVYCHVNVWQKTPVIVVHAAKYLAHIARAVGRDRIRHLGDLAVPALARQRVPGNIHGLTGGKLSNLWFIYECADLDSPKICELKQQLTLLYVLALFDWN